MEYAYYSVISPEGCASILWRTAEKASEAAEALKLTAPQLQELGVVDEIVLEPLGGAHKDYSATAAAIKKSIKSHLQELGKLSPKKLKEQRHDKFRQMGEFMEGTDE